MTTSGKLSPADPAPQPARHRHRPARHADRGARPVAACPAGLSGAWAQATTGPRSPARTSSAPSRCPARRSCSRSSSHAAPKVLGRHGSIRLRQDEAGRRSGSLLKIEEEISRIVAEKKRQYKDEMERATDKFGNVELLTRGEVARLSRRASKPRSTSPTSPTSSSGKTRRSGFWKSCAATRRKPPTVKACSASSSPKTPSAASPLWTSAASASTWC